MGSKDGSIKGRKSMDSVSHGRGGTSSHERAVYMDLIVIANYRVGAGNIGADDTP